MTVAAEEVWLLLADVGLVADQPDDLQSRRHRLGDGIEPDWSLPAPVDPWAIASAPRSSATRVTSSACNIRSTPTHDGYTPLRR